MIKQGVLVLILVSLVLLMVLRQEESFLGDYFFKRGPMEEERKWSQEAIESGNRDEVEYDTSEPYQDVKPNDGQVVMTDALDVNRFIISDFPPQIKVDSTYMTDYVDFHQPELYYTDDANYSPVDSVQKNSELVGTKLLDAFGQVDVQSIYKNIELYKTRGGNVYQR